MKHIFEKFPRISYNNAVNIKEFFIKHKKIVENPNLLSKEWVVTWNGKILNDLTNDRLYVEVTFKRFDFNQFIKIALPYEIINNLILGSIWKEGVSTEILNFNNSYQIIMRDANDVLNTNISYIRISDENNSQIFELLNKTMPNVVYKENDKFLSKFSDYNTLILVNEGKKKYIIHPLMFFTAHYSVSKSLNKALLTQTWEIVYNRLNLNHCNPKNKLSVLISDNLTIADAVFLYYVKNDKYSYYTVKNLVSRVRQNFLEKDDHSSYLKVKPYHTQPITLQFKGIELSDKVVLCTHIEGISMPQGETIYYDIQVKNRGNINQQNSDNFLSYQIYKPIYVDYEDEDFIVTDENPSNTSINTLAFKIKDIGTIRKLEKLDDIKSAEMLNGRKHLIPLINDKADAYGTGRLANGNGSVGFIQSFVKFTHQMEKVNAFGINDLDTQYMKLLKYAQSLKYDEKYTDIKIDCVDIKYENGQYIYDFVGEIVKAKKLCGKSKFPHSIYILRVILNGTTLYFFDCEAVDNASSSGIAIKQSNDHPIKLEKMVSEIKENRGRLSDYTLNMLERNQVIATYKHTNAENSNWVNIVLRKFNL